MLSEFYALLNFSLMMIYIIHEISILLKITRIAQLIVFLNPFQRSIRLSLFLKKKFFPQCIRVNCLAQEKKVKNRT